MLKRASRGLALILCLFAVAPMEVAFRPTPTIAATQSDAISYWGMNLYLSKRERRNHDNLLALAASAKAAGFRWTREELPWDLIEPYDNRFLDVYDGTLKLAADQGFSIIGMLLTTPAWARDASCRATGPAYWCPPADVDEYAQFAAWMTERYDGDGQSDAPGSPRIAAWEIWNEPNDKLLGPNIGRDGNARKRRYGEMLVAAYRAIKEADPTARVLIGGVYIFDGGCHDGVCDGLNFLNAPGGVFRQVPAARRAFDIFSIHPFIPTDRPDAPDIPRLITVEGRIRSSREWLNSASVGRLDAPIWITEIGWCTEVGTCPGFVQVTEEQQANYLVRSMVIAQQHGVQHTSWFQFEDAFSDSSREWGNAAIVRDFNGVIYPPKRAYYAYRTLVDRIGSATPAGPGPVHTHSYDPSQPYVGDNGVYDYRYHDGSTLIDVLWIPSGTATVSFPIVEGSTVTRVERDGAASRVYPSGGVIHLGLSERPFMIIQEMGLYRSYVPIIRR